MLVVLGQSGGGGSGGVFRAVITIESNSRSVSFS